MELDDSPVDLKDMIILTSYNKNVKDLKVLNEEESAKGPVFDAELS